MKTVYLINAMLSTLITFFILLLVLIKHESLWSLLPPIACFLGWTCAYLESQPKTNEN